MSIWIKEHYYQNTFNGLQFSNFAKIDQKICFNFFCNGQKYKSPSRIRTHKKTQNFMLDFIVYFVNRKYMYITIWKHPIPPLIISCSFFKHQMHILFKLTQQKLTNIFHVTIRIMQVITMFYFLKIQ